jgi:hypothetical protein
MHIECLNLGGALDPLARAGYRLVIEALAILIAVLTGHLGAFLPA